MRARFFASAILTVLLAVAWVFFAGACPAGAVAAEPAADSGGAVAVPDAAPVQAQPQEPNDAASASKPLVVAVLEFEEQAADAPGHGKLGRAMSEMLTTSAFNAHVFDVVERNQLEYLLSELSIGEADHGCDGTTAQKISCMAGANAILSGVISELGGTLRIDAKLVRLPSSKILAATKAFAHTDAESLSFAADQIMEDLEAQLRGETPSASDVPNTGQGRLVVVADPPGARIRVLSVRPKYASGMELPAGRHVVEVSNPGYVTKKQPITIRPGRNNQVHISLRKKKAAAPYLPKPLFSVVYRRGGSGPLRTLDAGATLASGDCYKVSFTPDRDGYAYVFQADGKGNVFQLFPMGAFDGVVLDNANPVRAESTYTLPAADKSFFLDATLGTERLYFVQSRTRDTSLEALNAALDAARTANGASAVRRAGQALLQALEQRERTSQTGRRSIAVPWAESRQVVGCYAYELAPMADGAVFCLAFGHN